MTRTSEHHRFPKAKRIPKSQSLAKETTGIAHIENMSRIFHRNICQSREYSVRLHHETNDLAMNKSGNTLSRPLLAHLCMLGACVFWGLMAPLGNDAMGHGISSITLVSFRVLGGATLFWLTSFFLPKETVSWKDRLLLAGASVFGLIFNQCCYTIGLGITSPSNASIMTTSMPIFAMILSFLILREPITWMKGGGVALGCAGALALVMTSMTSGDSKVGDIRGDLLCLSAQFSFALYLSLFNKLIRRYSVITVNKWMFLWAFILVWPFSYREVLTTPWAAISTKAWLEVGFVVFFGTYVAYILTMVAQQTLRPTVVSVYNYVQPIVAVSVSVAIGLATFKWSQALGALLVFLGVALVTKSKSRRDMEKEKAAMKGDKA